MGDVANYAMNKVIILAGAPDSASLDWTALEQTSTWQVGDEAQEDHPQWRVVPARPTHREQGVRRAFSATQAPSPSPASQTGRGLRYGRAEFVALDPSQSQSQSQSASFSRERPHGPSDDSPVSLSVQLPNALPPGSRTGLRVDSLLHPAVAASSSLADDFIQHSLAAQGLADTEIEAASLVDLQSTQDEAVADRDVASVTQDLGASWDSASATSELDASVPPLPAAADVPRWQPRTVLADIPSAAYLLGLAPQTVTVHLVAAVVAVGTRRWVRPRARRGAQLPASPVGGPGRGMSLVELVIGDETRSGFGVTMWRDGDDDGDGPNANNANNAVDALGPRDVVLLRHVALHVFGGHVYGSSLRRGQTKLHILYKGGGGGGGGGGESGQEAALFSAGHLAAAASVPTASLGSSSAWTLLAKTAHVRDWALRYVVARPGGRGVDADARPGDRRPAGQHGWMEPPADTQ